MPSVMMCGANVEKYLLANTQIKEWLNIPNRANLSMMSFAPKYTDLQSRYIGTLSALNLDVYSYAATYLDDITGQVKPFLPADTAIIGVPGRGKFLFGAVTYLDSAGQFQQAAAENVPVYNFNTDAQSTSLTIFSRPLPIPEVIDDFICLKVK